MKAVKRIISEILVLFNRILEIITSIIKSWGLRRSAVLRITFELGTDQASLGSTLVPFRSVCQDRFLIALCLFSSQERIISSVQPFE